ncbi:hypothetical protein ACFFHK_05620 [Gallibacterium trehalosifermentans]|uniref:Uncharacterized protein n=1 Tax=Gallibacterium trehalosifermentans TaxID=516935 RepID=A0ABV6H0N0_9PAST
MSIDFQYSHLMEALIVEGAIGEAYLAIDEVNNNLVTLNDLDFDIINNLETNDLTAIYNDDRIYKDGYKKLTEVKFNDDAVNYFKNDTSLSSIIQEIVLDRPKGCFIILEYTRGLTALVYNKNCYFFDAIKIHK